MTLLFRERARTHRTGVAAILGVALAMGATPAIADEATQARAPLPPTTVEVPAPDLLDVDLATGSFDDTGAGRIPELYGEAPAIADDHALGRAVATLDGSQAVRYAFTDGYDAPQLTVECTFRLDKGGQALDDRDNFCGSKQGGGFSLTAGEHARMMVNVDGTYYVAAADIVEGVWYHATGVWDGSTIALYLNGAKVDEVPAAGASMLAPPAAARYFFIGADTASAGQPEYLGTGQVAQAAIYSTALTAEQVASRYATVFAQRTEDQVGFTLENPSPDTVLTAPTTLAGAVDNPDLLAGELALQLDGIDVALGDTIGPGLARGEHVISYAGTDRLGDVISGDLTFSSAAIPTAGGTGQTSDRGTAQLSATATHPTGGLLRTSFLKGETSTAEGTTTGTIPAASFDRVLGVAGDIVLTEASDVADPLFPDDGEEVTSTADQATAIPALRADIEYTTAGQTILWQGEVDPAREVHLLVLNTETGRYEVAASARGVADDEVRLSATATEVNDDGGVVRTLVIGTDPFADDLDAPVQDSFENPDDVDFSIMHVTDNQYLSSASVGKTNPAEREVWAAGYTDTFRWLAENAETYNISYVAHTGDVIDHWRSNSTDLDRAVAEFEWASGAHELLDATEIPNSVLPGNHDNRDGEDTGPDSLFNQYFGAERYEALEQTAGWQAEDAEYHPWRPDDNENSYTLFSAAGQDFVVVSLGYDVTEEEAGWASDVFAQYSTRNGIVLTHAAHSASANPDGRGGVRSADGTLISERVMEENPNVMLLLAGHVTGATINVRQDVGQAGNHVVELTHDYQSYRISAEHLGITELGGYEPGKTVTFGATFFRLLQFDVERSELSVDTYSAHLDEFGAGEYDVQQRYDGREDDFRIPIQLQSRSTSFVTDALLGATPTARVIGFDVHASGEAGTVTWHGLHDGVAYTWFAVTRDADQASDGATLQALALAGNHGGPGRPGGPGAPSDPAGRLDEGIVQLGLFTGTGRHAHSEAGD